MADRLLSSKPCCCATAANLPSKSFKLPHNFWNKLSILNRSPEQRHLLSSNNTLKYFKVTVILNSDATMCATNYNLKPNGVKSKPVMCVAYVDGRAAGGERRPAAGRNRGLGRWLASQNHDVMSGVWLTRVDGRVQAIPLQSSVMACFI